MEQKLDEKDKRILELEKMVRTLNDEKKKLEETTQWMHDLIWQLVREREAKKEAAAETLPTE